MDLMTKVEKYKKEAFKPIISEDHLNETLLDSKFGGRPFISKGYKWPVCACGEPMEFFLQLNSSHLPSKLNKAEVFGEGLLQFFYCIKCRGYQPLGENYKIRVIKLDELSTDVDINEIKSCFVYRKIIDWHELIEYPRLYEILDSENLSNDEIEHYKNIYHQYDAKSGEKLLGWPRWVQWADYSDCPVCLKQMRYIFQVDSDKNSDYMLGNMGIGHITFCKDHPEQALFTWAS